MLISETVEGLDDIKKLLDSSKKQEVNFKKNLKEEVRKFIELFVGDSVKHMLDADSRFLVMGFPLGIPINSPDSHRRWTSRYDAAYSPEIEKIFREKDLTKYFCLRVNITQGNYFNIITENSVKQMIDNALTNLGAEFESHKELIAYDSKGDIQFVRKTSYIDDDDDRIEDVSDLVLPKSINPPQDFIPYSILSPYNTRVIQNGSLSLKDKNGNPLKHYSDDGYVRDRYGDRFSYSISSKVKAINGMWAEVVKAKPGAYMSYQISKAGPMRFYTIKFP